MLIPTIVAAFLLLPSTYAATLTFNWNVGWVSVSPDGFRRPAIGINGQWPCPTITATLGDTIIVNVVNNLGNETTGIHWHGMHQSGMHGMLLTLRSMLTTTGTNFMDGPTGVTQCPIPPGGNYTYNFLVRSKAPRRAFVNTHLARSMHRERSGIILTTADNIQMDYVDHSSSKIRGHLLLSNTAAKLS